MSIWRTIVNFFRKKTQEVSKKIDNPIVNHEFAIADSKKVIAEFKNKLTTYAASNKRIERELEDAKSDVKKWSEIKDNALKASDNESVLLAENEIQQSKARAIALNQQLSSNRTAIENFRSKIDLAEENIKTAESKHTQLSARLNAIELRESLSETSSKINDSPLSMLSELEQAVQEREDMLEAREDIETSKAESIAAKYAVSADVNAEFEKMFGK